MRLVFPGGVLASQQTISDIIKDKTGIAIGLGADRFYPYRITYDIECFLPKNQLPTNGGKLTFVNWHKLLSVSVCSNVLRYERLVCFTWRRDVRKLVKRFVDCLIAILTPPETSCERGF